MLSCAVTGGGALTGVVRHHSDDVQQTGEQLQAEVKNTNPKTCRRKEGSMFLTNMYNNTAALQTKIRQKSVGSALCFIF